MTTKPFHTTDDEFEALHQALKHSRSTAKNVAVPRQALVNILMDHARLAQLVKELEA